MRRESGADEGEAAPPWCSHVGGQSDRGILIGVAEELASTSQSHITELLFYACAEIQAATLPTPPASSSPGPDEGRLSELAPGSIQDVKVYALPLNSKIFRHAEKVTGLAIPSSDAYFLPYSFDETTMAQTKPQKRQSLSSLFEDATQKRRKVKGRGGESISQAMANIDGPSKRHAFHDVKGEELGPPLVLRKGSVGRRTLARASTVAAFPSSEKIRPISRGALANGKRSSLHRVESAISPRDSPTLSDTDSSYAQQNKVALTKVIMAGMRLHGLQQRKKPVKDEQPSIGALTTDVSEGEDEYKLVYHQAFKAASFTFRKQLNHQSISPEVMREVVDQLLTLFCSGSMAKDPFMDDLPGSSFQENDPGNAFDTPSTGAFAPGIEATWTTARTTKR